MIHCFLSYRNLLLILLLVTSACNSNGQTPNIAEADMELFHHLTEKTIPTYDDKHLVKLTEKAGERKLVLMGEASHGTAEFYNRRTQFSKMLIEDFGFNFIGVEGDWAAIFRLNKYVKNLPGAAGSAAEVLRTFDRWPDWMWGNTEVEALAEWLRSHNDLLPSDQKVGIYGIDVYGQWEALEKLIDLAGKNAPEISEKVISGTECFRAFSGKEWDYAAAVARGMINSCASDLGTLQKYLETRAKDSEKWSDYQNFRLHQKALVLKNAEHHFRTAPTDRAGSWNARVQHFWETSKRLLERYGEDARGIIWAHNTHVGDASHTTMGAQGQVNIGQLSRKELGPEHIFILGFGTYTGRVNAGSSWGSPMQIMEIPPSPANTFEHLFSQMPKKEFVLIFDENDRNFPPLISFRGHRAMGVVYNPAQEMGNYVPTMLAHRYDAFWFIKETTELQPTR
ncbi:MAG: erythromycin esterase family protein [Saprospirales bacterium]|nr:MAG: erythromycin esterase family protein [Saprospirales bacterium]